MSIVTITTSSVVLLLPGLAYVNVSSLTIGNTFTSRFQEKECNQYPYARGGGKGK